VINEPISRRTLLCGLGTAVALPMLEAMLPVTALAQAAKKTRPNRMVFIFVPNGMNMQAWKPSADGTSFELPEILQPLKNVKDQLSILTGLTQRNAFALGDGGGDHARSTSVWLTGVHPRKTAGADIKVGISVDQVAAQKVGNKTKFPSLEIGCERGAQAGNCDSGYSCAYSSSISWRSESTPVAKEVDPRLVFERLFSNGDPTESAESRARRELYRKSILDFVLDDANALKAKLGAHDQRKLDEYFTCVREIEQRVENAEKAGAAMNVALAGKPSGIPQDYAEHIHLLGDMMVLALQADLTRICTFMFANDGSNRNYRNIGVAEGHHDLSHHGRDAAKLEKIKQINTFHTTQLAYILEKMQATKDGDGTLLDNSMVVYGAGISDGDRHNHDDLPILLAGKGAGTIRSGRHVIYKNGTPMTNLFISMLERMGVRAETLGDSTGKLDQLF
jgi:hypothetical protein